MTLPFETGRIASRVYDLLAPLTANDGATGFSLLVYASALSLPYEEVAELAETGDNEEEGWSSIVDIDRIPDKGLPWLAQLLGITLQSPDPTIQRGEIRGTLGWNRGTVPALRTAAQLYLTGSKWFFLAERDSSPYHLTVITKTSETPDESKVLAALIAQKPAGLILDYYTLDGQTYQNLYENMDDYEVVFTTYADYYRLLIDARGTPSITGTYGSGTYGSGTYGGT